MNSNLKQAKALTRKSTSMSTSMRTESKQAKEVPAGATIISKTVRTETEEIENGYLVSKTYDISYRAKGSEHSDYIYITKKWYSKEDPFEINLKDKSLADAFNDD